MKKTFVFLHVRNISFPNISAFVALESLRRRFSLLAPANRTFFLFRLFHVVNGNILNYQNARVSIFEHPKNLRFFDFKADYSSDRKI